MKFKHILFFLPFLIPIAIGITSCNSGEDKWINAAQDSIKKTEGAKLTTEEEKQKNAYLIEAPNPDYSGDYLDKYENGNVKFKGFFRFGKRHGQWLAFYANGLMWSECFYDQGLKHGATNVFYENGKARYKGWFKKDLRDSLWVFYDEFGTEVKRATFKNDEEVSPSK